MGRFEPTLRWWSRWCCTVEIGSGRSAGRLRVLFTGPNLLLSGANVSLASFFAISSFSHHNRDSEEIQHACMKGVGLSFAASETLHLFYNFARSQEVLKLYSRPSVCTTAFRYLLYLSPLLSSTAFFVEFLALSPRENCLVYVVSATIPGSVTISLDTFLTYSFICHIDNVKMMNVADP
ncbi:hypothetical protein BJ741DRAFT_127821 [Chytriomyces cf. hyalinus JEL632]|nr:hypothetical protein BJ741DRAFT_127821 [Chytriomyces cf. hyalinus JEL632]